MNDQMVRVAKYASVGEAAACSSLSVRTIQNLIRSGRLAAHSLGRRRLILLDDLDSLVKADGALQRGRSRFKGV